MSIQIGDAVLTFLGDTTQLEAAFARINAQAKAQISPAAAEAQKLAGSLNTAGASASAAGEEFGASAEATARLEAQIAELEAEVAALKLQFDNQLTPALERNTFSMVEAKETAGLLSEAVGVTLPRGIRGFVAGLPGVGAALEKAFAATAVYFLIDALIQGAEKLSQFLADTLVYTKGAQAANDAQVSLNKAFADQGQKLIEATDALERFGKSRVDVLILDQAKIEAEVSAADLRHRQLLADAARNELDGNKETAQSKLDLGAEVARELEVLAKQSAAKELEIEAAKKETYVAIQKAKLDAAQSVFGAQLELVKAQAEAEIAFDGEAAGKRLLIEQTYQEAVFQLQQRSLQAKLAAGNLEPAQRIAINAELERIEKEHEATLIADAKKFSDQFSAIMAGAAGTSSDRSIADHLLGSDFEDKFGQAEDAAKALGIVLSGTLAENVEKAKEAVEDLENAVKNGAANSFDLLRGKLVEVDAEIKFAKSTNGSTKALEAQRDEIRKQLGLIPEYSKIVTATLQDFGKAFADATAAAISGQESFGAAMEAGTLRVVSKLAQYWADYFLARAIGDVFWNPAQAAGEIAAGLALEGVAGLTSGLASSIDSKAQASGNSTGTSGSSAGTSTAVTQPAQNPVQSVNVQRFAEGGLISRRTLAILGDSISGGNQREAVVPLGQDDDALNEIADRVHDRMASRGAGTVVNLRIDGVISADTLNKVTAKISKAVSQGSAHLLSSNSLRVTKRG